MNKLLNFPYITRALSISSYKKNLNIRERRWLEFLKDYDFNVNNYLGEAAVIFDILSRSLIAYINV